MTGPEVSDSGTPVSVTAETECRIRISRSAQTLLNAHFPDLQPGEAVDFLIAKYRSFAGTPAAVGFYEMSLRMDRLEESMTLLAATNAELSAVYFSQISGSIERLRAAALAVSRSILPRA